MIKPDSLGRVNARCMEISLNNQRRGSGMHDLKPTAIIAEKLVRDIVASQAYVIRQVEDLAKQLRKVA